MKIHATTTLIPTAFVALALRPLANRLAVHAELLRDDGFGNAVATTRCDEPST
jgi:hypothetical protein